MYVPVLMPVPDWFDYCGLVYSLISDIVIPPTLLFLKIVVAIWGHSWFHINFINVCSIPVKYTLFVLYPGILIRIALNL